MPFVSRKSKNMILVWCWKNRDHRKYSPHDIFSPLPPHSVSNSQNYSSKSNWTYKISRQFLAFLWNKQEQYQIISYSKRNDIILQYIFLLCLLVSMYPLLFYSILYILVHILYTKKTNYNEYMNFGVCFIFLFCLLFGLLCGNIIHLFCPLQFAMTTAPANNIDGFDIPELIWKLRTVHLFVINTKNVST